MAGQDLQSILAALAASGAASTPQPPQQQYPPPGQGPPPHGYPGMPPPSATPQMPAPYGLPQPTSGGSFSLPPGPPGGIDLSNLPKPSSVGSLSNFTDVMGNVRDRAAGLGVPPPHARPDPRMQYGQPRSRSRSPPRGSYNPYRDERRGGAGGYNNGGYRERTRSRSPPRRYNNFSPSMNRGGRERSPVRDSEVIEMDPSVVGLVIGRQGENLKRIEKMTGCKIQFITGPEGAGTRRQCRVDGPLPARKDAISEIFRTISENERGKQGGGQAQGQYQQNQHNRGQGGAYSTQGSEMPELRPGETQQQMMVPDKTVGLIIGRGGETIRDLQERSGCHINIVGENKSVGGLRPVNLIGTPTAAEQAKQLILDIVASDERPENNQNRNQNRNQAPPQQQQPMDQGKINESIHVPSEAVGMIIGKGGETIKNMQNETGCKINVSQPSGPDYEREIGLIGTRGAIEAAKRAIWEKVETVREKSGAPRGGPNNNSNNTRRDDGGGYGNRYSQPQQQQQGYGQPPAQQAMPPTGAAPASDPNQPDPYAAWGGYSNYVAWYYSSLMQQGGQAPGGAPPAGGRAPGA